MKTRTKIAIGVGVSVVIVLAVMLFIRFGGATYNSNDECPDPMPAGSICE